MPDDNKTVPAKSYQIQGIQDGFAKGNSESAEHFIARLRFHRLSVFPIGNGKALNMDGNGDLVLSPDEVMNILKDKDLKEKFLKSHPDAKRMTEVAEAHDAWNKANPQKPRTTVTGVEFLTEGLQKTITISLQAVNADNTPVGEPEKVLLDWSKMSAEHKKILKEKFEDVDVNRDGKISAGEMEFSELEKAQPKPAPTPLSPPKRRLRSETLTA